MTLDGLRRFRCVPLINLTTPSTCPPSAGVRHCSTADMTRRSIRPRWTPWLCLKASPCRRNTSATSSAGRIGPPQCGGVTSSRNRSSGLAVPRMVLVATCV